MADGGIAPIVAWLSPSFPVGAYAYSHGLEWAVEAGDVRDDATLAGWLGPVLDGFGRNDAIFVASAFRAAERPDVLDRVNELALALATSSEYRLETVQQGRSFLDAVSAAWPKPALLAAAGRFDEIAYPVALGVAAAAHALPLRPVLTAFLMALAGNLVSAGIRLAPIGQTAGQRVLAQFSPRLVAIAGEAEAADLDDVASATFRADLGSLRHETQYTRLFRS